MLASHISLFFNFHLSVLKQFGSGAVSSIAHLYHISKIFPKGKESVPRHYIFQLLPSLARRGANKIRKHKAIDIPNFLNETQKIPHQVLITLCYGAFLAYCLVGDFLYDVCDELVCIHTAKVSVFATFSD